MGSALFVVRCYLGMAESRRLPTISSWSDKISVEGDPHDRAEMKCCDVVCATGHKLRFSYF